MHLRLLGVLLVLSFGVVACGGGSTPSQAPATQEAAPAATVDPATAATVAGKITLEGTPPANAPSALASDGRTQASETKQASAKAGFFAATHRMPS